jgi:pSer/pThr/pTyr-binding forkhead associated (FHA) protein
MDRSMSQPPQYPPPPANQPPLPGSPYGQPPAPQYGQQPPPSYGQPAAPAYGAPAAPAYGQPAPPAPPMPRQQIPPNPVGGPGDLNEDLLRSSQWTDQQVAAAGIPIIDIPFVTFGGGIGSFVTVDYLRIRGIPPEAIRVLTPLNHPWESYEYLTTVSQIPRTERLRSDSASTPDNIWGFPSYALREAINAKGLKNKLFPLWNIATEPIFSNYYTPKAGAAFESMEKESTRIRYNESVVKGQVRMVRKRVGGGYFTVLTPPPGASATRRVAFRSRYVHIAVGYAGLKFLPDLEEYRTKYDDFSRVVNAYESHEHVYASLQGKPGTVMIRGGGIVASRVLQRLVDDRDRLGLQTQILHVFRTYISGAHGDSVFMRRRGGDGWAYQGFNYPKSVWGGQLKAQMRKLEGEQRATLYKRMGGTNTPIRKNWQEQLGRGRREGWYRVIVGTMDAMTPGPNGTLRAQLKTEQGPLDGTVDFVIDCTGLEADIAEHRVLEDLLVHSNAGRNPIGRLDVERTFEVRGTRNADGRMYASGSATLGGYFPGVDTFLGLQIAAQEITDDLHKLGFGSGLGVGRSTSQWWKWARNKPI